MGHPSPSHQWDVHRLGLFLFTPPWARGTSISPKALQKPLPLHNQVGWARAWVEVGPGLTSRDFRDTRVCLHYHTSDALADQSVIQGTFMLFCLWARVLFDYSASNSFIAASCVKALGLEVKTLEKPLYVNSPLGTKASVHSIFLYCELEISGILLTVDLSVMDMSEFDVILEMDWLMAH